MPILHKIESNVQKIILLQGNFQMIKDVDVKFTDQSKAV